MVNMDDKDIIQQKLYEAARLLCEVRLLARRNGELFREAKDLPSARYYESLANELRDNVSLTVQGLVRHCEGLRYPLHRTAFMQEELDQEMANLLRYLSMERRT